MGVSHLPVCKRIRLNQLGMLVGHGSKGTHLKLGCKSINGLECSLGVGIAGNGLCNHAAQEQT